MDGLQEVLRLRGDFQSLDDIIAMFASWYVRWKEPNSNQLHKSLTACRFDIQGCSIFDSTPRFPLPRWSLLSTTQNDVLSPNLQDVIQRLRHCSDDLILTATAFEKAAQLASFVNTNAHYPQFWRDGATAAKQISQVAHCLLSLPRPNRFSLSSRNSSDLLLTELVKLALLIMIAKLKQEFCLIFVELPALLERFSALLHIATCFDNQFTETVLWASMLVALVEQPDSRQVHVSVISLLMKKVGISTSRDAIEHARQLVWIDVLMKPAVKRLSFEVDCAIHSDPLTR